VINERAVLVKTTHIVSLQEGFMMKSYFIALVAALFFVALLATDVSAQSSEKVFYGNSYLVSRESGSVVVVSEPNDSAQKRRAQAEYFHRIEGIVDSAFFRPEKTASTLGLLTETGLVHRVTISPRGEIVQVDTGQVEGCQIFCLYRDEFLVARGRQELTSVLLAYQWQDGQLTRREEHDIVLPKPARVSAMVWDAYYWRFLVADEENHVIWQVEALVDDGRFYFGSVSEWISFPGNQRPIGLGVASEWGWGSEIYVAVANWGIIRYDPWGNAIDQLVVRDMVPGSLGVYADKKLTFLQQREDGKCRIAQTQKVSEGYTPLTTIRVGRFTTVIQTSSMGVVEH
jgi:hypothetical protein